MKKTGRCSKCDGDKLGVITQVRDQGERGIERRHVGTSTTRGLLLWRTDPVGEVEAYVCTECGYFEEYVRDAAKIPWNVLDGFTWLKKKPPRAPFR